MRKGQMIDEVFEEAKGDSSSLNKVYNLVPEMESALAKALWRMRKESLVEIHKAIVGSEETTEEVQEEEPEDEELTEEDTEEEETSED